jgi:hypothetical protein
MIELARAPRRPALLVAVAACTATLFAGLTTAAAPAHADVDTEFTDQLHTYGIYGQRDYNAWLAKITCKRLSVGIDADAVESATFLSHNLPTTTTAQSWQFLAATINTYCPQQLPVLTEMEHPKN